MRFECWSLTCGVAKSHCPLQVVWWLILVVSLAEPTITGEESPGRDCLDQAGSWARWRVWPELIWQTHGGPAPLPGLGLELYKGVEIQLSTECASIHASLFSTVDAARLPCMLLPL